MDKLCKFDRSKKNYECMKDFLDYFVKKQKRKEFKLIFTDDTGVIAYASGKQNTYENYKSGSILYNNVTEVNEINISQKIGKSKRLVSGRMYITKKICGNIQCSYRVIN